ncbi:unnamed protein product [Linum trigynum]|uniref:Uncharacterized protein n=1 Tax=Linum trigynum TaxID=586398 RepID=A0AAV2DTF6_9ROSI
MADGIHVVHYDKDVMEGLIVNAAETKDVPVFVDVIELEDGLIGDNEDPYMFQGLSKECEDIGKSSVARKIINVADSCDCGDEVEQPHVFGDVYLEVEEG